MTNDSAKNLSRFEELVTEINPVAVIRQEYTEIGHFDSLHFQKSYDDLDYLVFATLSLSSGDRVSLVRHEHSPNPGTEICISSDQQHILAVLLEVLDLLGLTVADLSWVHQDYRDKLYASQNLSVLPKQVNYPL
ncbi:hypothetical protein IQ255_11965 [Pleurocapsales cyanobacterium LEGE 10410]|nr:hypothetical protein [Pleurocapsales cyanobacterium LEGE 10410]